MLDTNIRGCVERASPYVTFPFDRGLVKYMRSGDMFRSTHEVCGGRLDAVLIVDRAELLGVYIRHFVA